MPRVSKHEKARRQCQKLIVQIKGRAAVLRAERRLCSPCIFKRDCDLLPLTTEGGDCPYQRTDTVEELEGASIERRLL